CTACWYFDVW
nr:immunoglobulin heavy chain junction region [Mus musculus]MBK4196372.1 immunoglobulin heavy chain junction region [Mus musculus]